MTRGEATKGARLLLRAGHHGVTICEDFETKSIWIKTMNRAWVDRTYATLDEIRADLADR